MLRKPAIVSWLLLITGLIVFLSAASWQYRRAIDKDRVAADFKAVQIDAEPIDLALALDNAAGLAYLPVRVRGRIDRDHVFLLDNQTRDGKVGVSVFAPVIDVTGPVVLVQFGWIPWPDRRQAPVIPPMPDTFDGPGLIAAPPSPGLIRDSVGTGPFPRTVMSIEPAIIGPAIGQPDLAARVFWPKDDPASGYVRDWRPPGIDADRHRGYALQWLSFAVAAVILFLILHRKKST